VFKILGFSSPGPIAALGLLAAFDVS